MVTLREVTGDPEELAALQRIFERDEDFALRVTGHPPGPADAQSTLMFVPEGTSPDDKAPFGVWAGDELVGLLDRWPWVRRLRLSVAGPTTRWSASGGGWASPRPARSVPGGTTSSSRRRS